MGQYKNGRIANTKLTYDCASRNPTRCPRGLEGKRAQESRGAFRLLANPHQAVEAAGSVYRRQELGGRIQGRPAQAGSRIDRGRISDHRQGSIQGRVRHLRRREIKGSGFQDHAKPPGGRVILRWRSAGY